MSFYSSSFNSLLLYINEVFPLRSAGLGILLSLNGCKVTKKYPYAQDKCNLFGRVRLFY